MHSLTYTPTTSVSCTDQVCPRRIPAFRAQATKGGDVLCPVNHCDRRAYSTSIAVGIMVDQKEMERTHTMTTSDEFTAPEPSDTAGHWAQFLAEMRAYFVSNVAPSVI